MKIEESNKQDFGKVIEALSQSEVQLPVPLLMQLFAHVVNLSYKDGEIVKKFLETRENLNPDELVSSAMLFTVNTIVLNIWELFVKAGESSGGDDDKASDILKA